MADPNVKQTIADNILRLRQAKGMTQLDLAKALNYSDKAVSKWERGESLPDVEVLISLAELFGVSLSQLVTPPGTAEKLADEKAMVRKRIRRNYHFIIAMSVLLVWLLSSLTFVVLTAVYGFRLPHLLSFLYAVPISCIVMLVLNSVWFEGRKNVYIISVLMWSCLATVFCTLLFALKRAFPLIFILGVPGQIIIILWCMMSNPANIAPNRFDRK